MEIDVNRLQASLTQFKTSYGNELYLLKHIQLKKFTVNDVDNIIKWLAEKLLIPQYTEAIAVCFPQILLPIVLIAVPNSIIRDRAHYHEQCIALSKLLNYSPEVHRYAIRYFSDKEAPFAKAENDYPAEKSNAHLTSTKTRDVTKCCYKLLSSDPEYYKCLWDWSLFIECYSTCSDSLQQLYFNNTIAILYNMNQSQLSQLNMHIPDDAKIDFDTDVRKSLTTIKTELIYKQRIDPDIVVWDFLVNSIIDVDGVLLPAYNPENAKYFRKSDGIYDRIVKVKSTRSNLRSISLGISSGKGICLVGPVGSGKTSLVEYLARKTGRVIPKELEYQRIPLAEEKLSKVDRARCTATTGQKRKFEDVIDLKSDNIELNDAFLRIQLSDQTDSKMLLGQYRCTDVPGEFIWLPGVLTRAVMNGCWLLLEDLDQATQDTYSILSNILENNYLSVPGFRDCIRIAPGFQLFVTVRSQKHLNTSQKAIFSLLEKYLYRVNILPLSRSELCEIVSGNYPELSTITSRIVDVFLMFSRGDHSNIDENGTCTDNPPFSSSLYGTNSGRLVSTRDLLKLCQRSILSYSASDAECAYIIFQNAVDLFCSYLPESANRTKMVTKIGAKLGIIPSRCEFFCNDHKPDIASNEDGVKVGRGFVEIKPLSGTEKPRKRTATGSFKENVVSKKSKVESNLENVSYALLKNEKKMTFSFTRLASSLLERIVVCVNHQEPVLLVGETGVGKTSSIQYLAAATNHKLVVVNMNNQSDVSDLIGGYKPVDLAYIVAPIKQEFEILFRMTFNEARNEKFLLNVSSCYNRGDFSILVKLMIRIINMVWERVENKSINLKDYKSVLGSWRLLESKLVSLNAQLSKSMNISFAFITGSLVNCIKNGDWVLLDEINLASDETLQCLSTILEPEGSIVLLERGDLTPVKRHNSFRIFACMNPSTDVGKKDLSVGIRNRFTEFFVDELSSENDLRILVSDYLMNTGITNAKILTIVKLYKKLKSLSEIELNDGLGNRPIFSLRTLCRALTICAKNLCGSIERNLFEGFCASFLTQLDIESHEVVLNLIKNTLVSNYKAAISQQIPCPGSKYLSFGGYWIHQGQAEINECSEYIITESVRRNIQDVARIISIGGLPILLQGPTSAGKTSLIEYIAKQTGNHCLRINNHEHTDLQEYIGTYTSDVTGKLVFREGILVQAMRNGFWIILDELNLAPTDILEALNRVLDDNRELFIPETQKVVKAHSNFMLFATQNPPGLYGGRKTLSRAFKNRFIELHFNEIPKSELEVILEKRCLIPKSYAQKMVNCMTELQVNRKTTTVNKFTLRDLFRWGNRYTHADKDLLNERSYDWNQHLIDEGFLVLSAKGREKIEEDIVKEALFNNFRQKVDVKNLYDLHTNTSLVTKSILESLLKHSHRHDIVWTPNMTRMAVLTAKALQFNEPILLIGPTGCGKTTICQIIASVMQKKLRILNCHMHTEGSDFLGGLRPFRKGNGEQQGEIEKAAQLFQWVDGPLVHAMQEGSFFLVDEISLAEDSVLERLNSVLEPSRILVLAEKGGTISSNISKEFIINASNGFQFLATMNPGGDFGKKELSPALRNRFTEIWCEPSASEEDLVRIVTNSLRLGSYNEFVADINKVATVMIRIVMFLKSQVEKFRFSIRDILSWAQYLVVNERNPIATFDQWLLHGLNIVFLDSLEMIPFEAEATVDNVKQQVIEFAMDQLQEHLGIPKTESSVKFRKEYYIEQKEGMFGMGPFFIQSNAIEKSTPVDFYFNAPTTRKNLQRLLSALSIKKAILLEGPPGVGKTSIVENLAKTVGFKLVRINLCEHTDLADLFGTDLPAEEKSLDSYFADNLTDFESSSGKFVWRDGPLLAALKSQHTWILLDELNLAPQSVLEGLNAILDHRGEVFIPELNKTFTLESSTRIFATQNPLAQGGGRKGLPQSFLNRFTKAYLKKLNTVDLLYVVKAKYSDSCNELKSYFEKYFSYISFTNLRSESNIFEIVNLPIEIQCSEKKNCVEAQFDLLERMVRFSEGLDRAVSNFEFGIKGGPFEINLRDLLRWCELLFSPKTGFQLLSQTYEQQDSFQVFQRVFYDFLLILYERMKLIYYQRMRSDDDRKFIRKVFSEVFQCNAEVLNQLSEDVSVYWTDSELFLNDIALTRNSNTSENVLDKDSFTISRNMKNGSLILPSQMETLKSLVECVHMDKPAIISGPSNTGKTKVIDLLCAIRNKPCSVEVIDDSVMGSFQQVDLNRHLEELSRDIELIYIQTIQTFFLSIHCKAEQHSHSTQKNLKLMKLWNDYLRSSGSDHGSQTIMAMSEELFIYKKRIRNLLLIVDELKLGNNHENIINVIAPIEKGLKILENIINKAKTINTGSQFEWVDSKIVTCLKYGGYICLDHANLCSPAILDRLNPAFEPNGTLLLSEKGVGVDDDNELVQRNKNFQAFLVIDPKYGELSRAMRNRCIELDSAKNEYSEDDLRTLIYVQGITENYLIEKTIKIHRLINNIDELYSFDTSYLLHSAYLITCNKRIGLTDQEAVCNSFTEAYVRSSIGDFLDSNIETFLSRMQEVIKKESEFIEHERNVCNIGNIILRADDLNTMSIIKMHCEPLLGLVKCYPDLDKMKKAVLSIFFDFHLIEFSDAYSFIYFYIYILYEISSFDDLHMRFSYVKKLLETCKSAKMSESEMTKLHQINESMYTVIYNAKKLLHASNTALPWNSKMFPRIRNYRSIQQGVELHVSAQLLINLLAENIENESKKKNIKLTERSALSYSYAISSEMAVDKVNSKLLRNLWQLLNSTKDLLLMSFEDISIGMYDYVPLILSTLWWNRLYLCSKGRLFINKRLNDDLIRKLLVHFKWLDKFLLNKLPNRIKRSDAFERIGSQIRNIAKRDEDCFRTFQKKYRKRIVNFMPHYLNEQVCVNNVIRIVDEITELIPTFGHKEADEIDRIIWRANTLESIKLKNIIGKYINPVISYIHPIENISINNSEEDFKELAKSITTFFENAKFANQITPDMENLNNLVSKLKDESSETENGKHNFANHKVLLTLIPLKDYFAVRALFCSNLSNDPLPLNDGYLQNMLTHSCTLYQLFNILMDENYHKFKSLWKNIESHITRKEFESFLNFLTTAYYRNFNTFNRIILKMLQGYNLSGISLTNDMLSASNQGEAIKSEISYNGPILTSSIISLLFHDDGIAKCIELGEIDNWRKLLNEMASLMWNNSLLLSDRHDYEQYKFNSSLKHAKKIVLEIEYLQKQQSFEDDDSSLSYFENLQMLSKKLTAVKHEAESFNISENEMYKHFIVQNRQLYYGLLNALIGSIELTLCTFMPLIDPVEKNAMKMKYKNEDNQTLKSILISYDAFRIVTHYSGLGREIYDELKIKAHETEFVIENLSKKAALRPDACKYNKLTQDVLHFMDINGQAKHFLALVANVESCVNFQATAKNKTEFNMFLLNCNETINKIDLWITNSQRFLFDINRNYAAYYNDFIEPIECAIVMMRTGFEDLKAILVQHKSSFHKSSAEVCININKGGELNDYIQNIFRFPHLTYEKFMDPALLPIFERVSGCESLYVNFLKAKLLDIKSQMSVTNNINKSSFNAMQNIFNVFNDIWKREDEKRRKQKLEDESLYKTLCKDRSEEQLEAEEIHHYFPTYVEEDFEDFIPNESLDKEKKSIKIDTTKLNKELISSEDCKFIVINFICIMEQFANLYYYRGMAKGKSREISECVSSFKLKFEIFTKVMKVYKLCFNSLLDGAMFNSYIFMIGLQQDLLQDISVTVGDTLEYNYYKDSNIVEIKLCTTILDRVEQRTNSLLNSHPDHAVLLDIIRILNKIRSLPCSSPIVRFNIGFQILREKISQWNEVAHKNNNLLDLETEIAEFIQKWTRMELQCWRNSLSQTVEKVQAGVYKFWFFLYNALHEYINVNDSAENCSVDIFASLHQFVENSNYADFSIRLRLLASFEFYLHYYDEGNSKRKQIIIAMLRNIKIYFSQFSQVIDETMQSYRTPIEKKLRELVKIESYNKDLSYFSMKNNIARVHRKLNKVLKEYENQLNIKISDILKQKENASGDYSMVNDKGINLRYEPKHTYYMLDVKNFIASEKLKKHVEFSVFEDATSSALLGKCDKLFSISRNVVRETIKNAEYSSMILRLDSLLSDQIETCEYLRKLQVDRTQEKAKQKMQCKQILTQKRKGLADLYKTLTTLGMNYKTGLMELALNTDFVDFEINPFCVKTMFTWPKHRKLDQNLIFLNENLDLYYAKCIFKLKLLQNILLNPNEQLGVPNTDRMKGFSIDMFLLLQEQRKMLSKSIRELFDLRKKVTSISELAEIVKSDDYIEDNTRLSDLEIKHENLKAYLCEIQMVIDQYLLLWKCLPDSTNTLNSILVHIDKKPITSKDDPRYAEIMNRLANISQEAKSVLQKMHANSKKEFLHRDYLKEVELNYTRITSSIGDLINEIDCSANGPIVMPLLDLLKLLDSSNCSNEINMNDHSKAVNINDELDFIVHSILLSLQKLYKRNANSIENGTNIIIGEDPVQDDEIKKNHLKKKIHQRIMTDLEDFHLSEINRKISQILLLIKHEENRVDRISHMKKILCIQPILEQFSLVGDFYLFQQLGAHKVTAKMLSIMLTVFIDLGTKGFCIPPDLMEDEKEGEMKDSNKGNEHFGLEDGTGENDISDKIESEDQLDDAKRPEDRKNDEQENAENCKEDKGIEMSEDFDANLQDLNKDEANDGSNDEDGDEEVDKQMDEVDESEEKLDDQIWGSDEENDTQQEEDQMSEDEATGGNDKSDVHNDFNADDKTKKTDNTDENQDGLDATDDNPSKEKNKSDVDSMKNDEKEEADQANPYHNQLEDPPQPEELDLDECNLDESNPKDGDDQQFENPFDIDNMKDLLDAEANEEEEGNDAENEETGDAENGGSESDFESESDVELQKDINHNEEDRGDEDSEMKEDEDDKSANQAEESEEKKDEVDENDEQKAEINSSKEDAANKSNDKPSKEDNVQSKDEKETGSSNDAVANQANVETKEEDFTIDQDNDNEGDENVGNAEKDISKTGHQGAANTEQMTSDKSEVQSDPKQTNKSGTNDQRTLAKIEEATNRHLKTIDKMEESSKDTENNAESSEYQHVKEAKPTDSTTLDFATEEQSKEVHHEDKHENEQDEQQEESGGVDINEEDSAMADLDQDKLHELTAEKIEQQKSSKPSKLEKGNEKCENSDKVEVEGDSIETHIVPREGKTTAHFKKEMLSYGESVQELSTSEILEFRKAYESNLTATKSLLPQHEDYELWQNISNKMSSNARELCEQLRLILEPTKCTRMKGDYRTGRRLNMRKIIPYIASQFRKDKIWLRRTKPSQRDYKITIAIDDSKSMHHNNSKMLTLQAISLVSQALTLLESGKLSILTFGELSQTVLHHTDQFDGPKLIKGLTFAQNQSKIAEMLHFILTINSNETMSSENGIFENLLLIISDGRNIFSEGEQKVKNSIKLARLQRIFLVYIIIDNPDNKHSILDIRVPQFSFDRKTITMRSYLDTFPFPYYVIVRDLDQLPIVLSEAMRQWFELVNSE